MQSKLRLIIVDIDGTLLPGSLEKAFFRYLREKGHVGWLQVLWNALSILLTSGVPRLYKFKAVYLRGMRVTDVELLAEKCYESLIHPTLFNSMRSGLDRMKKANIQVLLLSGTLSLLARLLAADFEIPQYVASEPVITRGRFSGSLIEPHPYGKRKVDFATRVLEQQRLGWECVGGIADRYEDRFLLEKCAKAAVVNPRGEISKLADNRGWGRIHRLHDSDHVVQIVSSVFGLDEN